ncbi:importin alpha re-exporter [Cylindrobasidium torrendii FP15055 ss-10]|uniref:Importin alpha re-exporter n=1 Tax=Cylindrobasidium torrendii FP15055 ss-10 TaxID=1314674 RepID=A0A0D7AWU9_9AGAR|nr:importin alpha re-exporter [Cylindrobasidium torrendii FP15055 ss-10]
MSNLPQLLLASLNPTTRKEAEAALDELSAQPGFLSLLVNLVLEQSQDRAVRLSGSVYLKNIAKLRWEEEDRPLQETDKASLRSQLVPAMLALASPSDKAIRAQVAEAVSLIAELDFPGKWPDLIDQLVASLSLTDYNVNIGVLQTAHSIFNPWRAHVRSDELFTEINYVFGKFMEPFIGLFRQTATLLLNPASNTAVTTPASNYELVAQAMTLLLDIFYDFTCQDLPPAIEDATADFFGKENGWFHTFMAWDPAELKTDPDEPTPSWPSKIKGKIFEIAELFLKIYSEQLLQSGTVEVLIQDVWSLIGSNRMPGISDDQVVSQALRFVSAAIRTNHYQQLFASQEVISSLVEGVVVPNVSLRECDIEQFEDDPLEFIRLDLSITSSDMATRRHAAADVLQALVAEGNEAITTQVVGNWIQNGLTDYQSNPTEKWRSKDSAIYLLTAIATKGSTVQQGVTSTNTLINVVDFFGKHVFQDLEATSGVHALLQVDAIRFLMTFRNQLTKEQLLSVLPLLIRHVGSGNYVCTTYAAIAVERILSMKQVQQFVFAPADVRETAAPLINALLTQIEAGGSPQKVAENDHLMRCIMRVIFTSREALVGDFQPILARLVGVLGVISTNPSNPKFDQYIFESISGLIKFIVKANPAATTAFEQALFQPFTVILQQDIDQYIPYVFQLLAQMLETHTGSIPEEYRGLLGFLMTPAIWQQKGSIPGLVKLLKAYLSRDSAWMVQANQMPALLGIVQQRLIPSKLNDMWGFELLEAVVRYVPGTSLQQYFTAVMMTLLNRLQSSKTDKYAYLVARFFLYINALDVQGAITSDYVISVLEGVQSGLWTMMLTHFVMPEAARLPTKDRKLGVVGIIRLLTTSTYMLQQPNVQHWPSLFNILVKQFLEPQHLEASKDNTAAGFTEIDFEEQTAGYQAAYSQLAASASSQDDPVAYVQDPKQYVVDRLKGMDRSQLQQLVGSADRSTVIPFLQGTGLV